MLRKFTRYDPDGRTFDVWINDQHIVSINPSGSKNSTVATTNGGSWLVAGSAADHVDRLS